MRIGLIYTLVFIKNDYKILLGLKKRGLGKGKWNGFGGKVEKHESILEGAIRETKEESNLRTENLKHIGILAYEVLSNMKTDIVHIFTADKYMDLLKESEEMKPQWFDVKNIPYKEMWPDAELWFPLMLKDKFIFAHVQYEDNDTYKKSQIYELNSINSVLKQAKTLFPNITI